MSILLSPRHGVNPAIPRCYYCFKPMNTILLVGKLPDDKEAPKNAVWDSTPCDECEYYMKEGILLISVKDGEMEKQAEEQRKYNEQVMARYSPARRARIRPFLPNPHRTGGFVVILEKALKRAFDAEWAARLKRTRFAFVPDEAWDKLGLPRGDKEKTDGQAQEEGSGT